MNDEGEVTELSFNIYCLENEQLKTILSYNTIEILDLEKNFLTNDEYNKSTYGCLSLPTNYDLLNTLPNLKSIYLLGIANTDINIIYNISKSIENSIIGDSPYNDLILTQEIIDTISKLTNLNSLFLKYTEIGDALDFSKFRNLKKLTYLALRMT